jgi:hypothetical protein
MKSKVMGADAANRRKNEASGVRGKAAGSAGAGASSKASVSTSTRPMPIQGFTIGRGQPPAHMMSGSKDKAPPSRTAKAEIKGYLSKVAREDRETEKSKYKTLDRAMGVADAKALKEDLRAAREDRMSKSSAPSRSPRPMSRSSARFEDGGMVRGCKGVQMSGKSFKGDF